MADEEHLNRSVNELHRRQDRHEEMLKRQEDILKPLHHSIVENPMSQPAPLSHALIFIQFQQQQHQMLDRLVEQIQQVVVQQQLPSIRPTDSNPPMTSSSPYRPHSQTPHIQDAQQSKEMNNSMTRERDLSKKFQQFPRWNCRFSGSMNDEKALSLNEYIATIQNFMMTVGVSPQGMIRQVFPTLRDDALRYYLTIQHNDLTLEEFFERLRERFGNQRGLAETILALSAIKLDDKTTIHDHIDEIIFQLKSADQHLSDSEQLTIICRTLPEEYSQPIRIGKVASVAELKAFCYSVFPINTNSRKRIERHDRYEPKRVMALEVATEEEKTDSEDESPLERVVNVIRKWDKRVRTKHQFEPNHVKRETSDIDNQTSNGTINEHQFVLRKMFVIRARFGQLL